MLVRTQALFSTKEDKGRKASGVVLVLIFMIGLGALLLVSGLTNSAADESADAAGRF